METKEFISKGNLSRIKRELHFELGIDFQLPHEEVIITKPYTINSITSSYNICNTNIIILINLYREYNNSNNSNNTYYITLLKNNNFSHITTNALNKFSSITAFNNYRKQSPLAQYCLLLIIPTSSINSKFINPNYNNITNTFLYNFPNNKVNYKFYNSTSNYSKEYNVNYEMNGHILYNCNYNGKSYNIKNTTMYGRIKIINKYDTENGLKYYKLNETIDKSGYSIFYYRNQLKARLTNYKISKLQNNIKHHLNKSYNLQEQLLNKKENLISKLECSISYNEVKECNNTLNNLTNLFSKYNKHIQFILNSNNNEIREWCKYNSNNEVEENLLLLQKEIKEFTI